jgi:hypothetical protein
VKDKKQPKEPKVDRPRKIQSVERYLDQRERQRLEAERFGRRKIPYGGSNE